MDNREVRREYKRREMILTEYKKRIDEIFDNINKGNHSFVTKKTSTRYSDVKDTLINMYRDIHDMKANDPYFNDFLDLQIRRIENNKLQELFPYYDKEPLVVFLEDEKDDR